MKQYYIKWEGRNSGLTFEEVREAKDRMSALQQVIDEHPANTVIVRELKEVKPNEDDR